MKILFATAEAHPLMKTGGLGDVCGSLPGALRELGHDVRMALPAYPQAVERTEELRLMAEIEVPGAGTPVRILQGLLPGPSPTHEARVPVYLIDAPLHFARPGHPYLDAAGRDWSDNAQRFATFARAVVALALDQAGLRWRPELVHAHDWHTGLVPALLAGEPGRPATVFTIHNLAYQGIVDKAWLPRLGLGWDLFTVDGLEFWDRLSFLKAGVNFCDAITTVSPTYAEEIQRPEYGYGFDGVVRARAGALTGILNGIDTDAWNPATDAALPAPYDARTLAKKAVSKRAALEAFGLPADDAAMARPLVGMVSRLVDQKGFDLVAQVADSLVHHDAGFVVLGSGDARYEQMWRTLAARRPETVGVHLGFDERLAHLVEAGADVFLMPSRYEPCGLNQMYSQRYGTVPVVRATGGLVDTVQPWDPATTRGTGFLFSDYSGDAMLAALRAALDTFGRPAEWKKLQQNGMKADFSWDRSARAYVKVYKGVIAARRARRPKASRSRA